MDTHIVLLQWQQDTCDHICEHGNELRHQDNSNVYSKASCGDIELLKSVSGAEWYSVPDRVPSKGGFCEPAQEGIHDTEQEERESGGDR